MSSMMSAPVMEQRPRVSTRERLIDAGYELFLRNGFHAVGLDRVLRDARVSKQTFYNHFECKDDLVLAVLEKRSEVELAGMREMLNHFAGSDARGRLDALWDVLEQWFNSPGFRGCIFITAAAEFPSPNDPAHAAATEHTRKQLALIEELCLEAGAASPTELAERLMMLVDGAVIAKHVIGNDRAAQVGRDAARLLVAKYIAA